MEDVKIATVFMIIGFMTGTALTFFLPYKTLSVSGIRIGECIELCEDNDGVFEVGFDSSCACKNGAFWQGHIKHKTQHEMAGE